MEPSTGWSIASTTARKAMSAGDGFQGEPEDLRKAGDNATDIGDRLLRDADDLVAAAISVSGGLDGFALTGALRGCAQAWEDERRSLGRETRAAGERLHGNAGRYEEADDAARGSLDATTGALGQAGG